jgi:chitinase
MKRTAAVALSLLLAAVGFAQDRKIVGYYPNWVTYGRNYQVLNIPASRLDVVNYAFARIDTAGRIQLMDAFADVQKRFPVEDNTVAFFGCFNQLVVLKKRFPHLRTVISIADNASEFSTVASTAARRATFSSSVVSFLVTYKFDGVDIDWEFPVSGSGNAADKQNFTLLMQQLRNDLNLQGVVDGKNYLLTAAVSGGYPEVNNLEVASLSNLVDWLNVMIYDYAGSWNTVTGHLAPLYGRTGVNSTEKWNANYVFTQYLAAGASRQKLFFGVPFYARGWRGVPATNNGLYQTLAGQSGGIWGTGTYGYRDIAGFLANSPAVYNRFWDANVRAPYVYAPSLEGGLFITYDDVQSVTTKANYSISNQFGGMMAWELSGDVPTGSNSLLATMDDLMVPGVGPVSRTVTFGSITANSPNALVRNDGDEFGLAASFAGARTSPTAEVTFETVLRLPNPATLNLELFGRHTGIPTPFTVEGFDWTTNSWVAVGTGTVGTTNATSTVTFPTPARFIQSTTSRVRTRLSLRTPSNGPRGTQLRLDSAIWKVAR